MKCWNCSNEMDKSWTYCPSCGEQKKTFFRNPFKGFGDKFFMKSVDRMFKQVFDSIDDDFMTGDSKSFTIKMSNLDGEPDIKIYDSTKPVSEPKSEAKKVVDRVLKNVEEPDARVKSEGNSLFLELKIPSIKSINDVEITRLGESVEIRAFGKDKSYFKVLNAPASSKVLKKELRDGSLFVELG